MMAYVFGLDCLMRSANTFVSSANNVSLDIGTTLVSACKSTSVLPIPGKCLYEYHRPDSSYALPTALANFTTWSGLVLYERP